MKLVKGRKKMSRQDLMNRCAELRRRGMSHHDIGKQMGLSDDKAAKVTLSGVTRAAALANYQAEMLNLEVQRLDEMQAAIYGQAIGEEVRIISTLAGDIPVHEPDTDKIKTILLIMKRRDALLGIDAPKVTEITGADGGPLTISMIDACLRGAAPQTQITHTTQRELPAPSDVVDAEFSDVA